MKKFSIVIHGGAGVILREKLTDEMEKDYRTKLKESVLTGYNILKDNGSAIDAVQMAVNIMEDSPLFNAGKGAVFNSDGINEQDATIMDGSSLNSGAVALVRHVKNPIDLARAVMENSEHVFLGGESAEKFAKNHNIELVDKDYFFYQRRWDQYQAAQKKEKQSNKNITMLDHSDDKSGTVGAVAIDQDSNIAAATSSGGMTNKTAGRIGDSAIQGAGTYANNKTCAVSTTGHGEFFIRAVSAYQVSALMEYKNLSLNDACQMTIDQVGELGGGGGLIAVDHDGNSSLVFNSPGMYRAYFDSDMTEPIIKIFNDE